MKVIFNFSALLLAITLNAERPPLTLEQLQQEADQVCTGEISDIQMEKECFNLSCTDYKLNFIAKMNTASCANSDENMIYARYFEYVYNEGNAPPGPSGHNPQPNVGQTGTIYLKEGEIVYPNGWVSGQAN